MFLTLLSKQLKHTKRPLDFRYFSSKNQSSINLESSLSPDEYVGIIDEDDNDTGEIMTRREMRMYGKWHRSTSIFVINEHH